MLVATDQARTRSRRSALGPVRVNILGAERGRSPAALRRRRAARALAGVEHQLIDEVPVLAGTVAWLACELEQELDGGDHAILIGRPLEAGADPEARPLVFYGGRYHAGTLDGP